MRLRSFKIGDNKYLQRRSELLAIPGNARAANRRALALGDVEYFEEVSASFRHSSVLINCGLFCEHTNTALYISAG